MDILIIQLRISRQQHCHLIINHLELIMTHSLQHLKEYTSYEFDCSIKPQNSPNRTISLTFKGQPSVCKTDLPSYLIDSSDQSQQLFILKWTMNSTSSLYLDIFQFQDKKYQRIGFNMRPSLICAASGLIYIVGGQQIYVIELGNLTVLNSYSLGNDEFYALEPATLKGGDKQKSAILYSWNKKTGLTKRAFSRNSGESGGLISTAFNMFKIADQSTYGTLKILIPNVLGLLIAQGGQQIFAVNLTQMKVIFHTSFRLEQNLAIHKPASVVVKYEESEVENKKLFDDRIIVGVGDKQSELIHVFEINFKYDEEQKRLHFQTYKNQQELPALNEFINGYGVEWDRIQINQCLSVSSEGKLIDFILDKKGIVYMSNSPSRIPTANYVQYDFPEYQHPILPLQHNICRCYLKDFMMNVDFNQKHSMQIKNNEQNLINSVMTPNRYSVPFLLAATGLNNVSKLNHLKLEPRKLLLIWYKAYKPKSILIFNGDIVILRESSLSTLLPITKEQFQLEFQPGEELLRHFRESRTSDLSEYSFISKQSSKFQKFAIGVEIQQNERRNLSKRGFRDQIIGGKEKNLKKQIQRNEEEDRMDEQKSSVMQKADPSVYNKYFKQIFALACGNLDHEEQKLSNAERIENKSIVFAQNLLQNRTKDALQFYFKVLNRTFEGSNYTEEKYTTQQLLMHYLRYFNMVQNNSSFMVMSYGEDFISYLINKYVKISYQESLIDIDQEVKKIIRDLFHDLVVGSEKVSINNMVRQLIIFDKEQNLFAEKFLFYLFHQDCLHIFPQTYSVLAGVCSLPIDFTTKNRFLTSFVLSKIVENKTFSENANKILCQFKEMVRYLHGSPLGSYKQIVQVTLSKMGGKNYQTNLNAYSSGSQYEQTIHTQDLGIEGLDLGLDIDFWKLIRVSDSDQLDNALRARDVNEIKKIKETVINELNIRNGSSSITNDDILAAWVFLYRYYVHRLQSVLEKRENQNNQVQYFAQQALDSLMNVSEYYQTCYKTNFIPSEDFLISKVCAQMIGLDPLTVYPSIPANTDILDMIRFVSSNEQIEGEVFSNFEKIVFVYLSKCLKLKNQNQIEGELLKINKYISKKTISQMILTSTELRQLYRKLPQNVKRILGYTDINFYDSRNSGDQVQSPYSALDFRNAFIENALQK